QGRVAGLLAESAGAATRTALRDDRRVPRRVDVGDQLSQPSRPVGQRGADVRRRRPGARGPRHIPRLSAEIDVLARPTSSPNVSLGDFITLCGLRSRRVMGVVSNMGTPRTMDARASVGLRRFARTTPGIVGMIAFTVAGLCVIAG